MQKVLKILKKVKLRNILILIVLLAFNAYAWFIYTTKVSLDLTAHVSAWDVQFVAKDGGIFSHLDVNVDRVYPGMEDYERIVNVQNKGELNVELSYEINSIRIMDDVYEVNEETGLTSEEIEQKIKNDYPFKINIVKDDSKLLKGEGDGSFKITVTWPYESGDDETDSEWGRKAYEYYQAHPDSDCIELKMTLKATQNK